MFTRQKSGEERSALVIADNNGGVDGAADLYRLAERGQLRGGPMMMSLLDLGISVAFAITGTAAGGRGPVTPDRGWPAEPVQLPPTVLPIAELRNRPPCFGNRGRINCASRV
jgi:hypothetical protein